MKRRDGGRERPRWSAAAGALAALAAGLLTLTPLVERLELRTHYARFQLRGARPTGARIVIAEITDQTLRAWPEPLVAWGSHYAAAIRQARRLGARWIGIDQFLQLLTGSDSLPALQQAVHGGGVVLANEPGQDPENSMPELLFAMPGWPENVG